MLNKNQQFFIEYNLQKKVAQKNIKDGGRGLLIFKKIFFDSFREKKS